MTAEHKAKYRLVAPDGGWGYAIAFSLTLACNCTIMPMMSFGLIFGGFLSTIGDETTGTALSSGIFNTCFNVTGFLANYLLQKYTYRIVTLLGGIIFFCGTFMVIFANSLPHFLVSFGVVEGLGMGLLFPALFTALNCYFDKKLNLVNSVAQAFMVLTGIIFPYIGQWVMLTYGYRGTVAIISAFSLNMILAAVMLQPVEWHMKKEKIPIENEDFLTKEEIMKPKPRNSIINIADRAVSVTTLNKLDPEKSFLESLNLNLFKDPIYINIAVGIALCFLSDAAFISLIPSFLMNSGFSFETRSFFLSMFFAADLAARILISVMSVLLKVPNRYLFLLGAFFTVIFRTAFTISDEYYWKLGTVCALGFLRCFIQTPLPLVIAEQYPDTFASAFSLYMVVCGGVSLFFGPMLSAVKAWTQSDIMVVHVLTLAYLICVISWLCELLFQRRRRMK